MKAKAVKTGLIAALAVLIPCLLCMGGMLLLPRMVGTTATPDADRFSSIAIPIQNSYSPEYPYLIARDADDPASLRTAELPTEAGELPYRILTSFSAIRRIAAAVNGLTYEGDTVSVTELSSLPHEAFRFFKKDGSPHVVTVYGGEYVAFDGASAAYRIRTGRQALTEALTAGYEAAFVPAANFPTRMIGVGTRFDNLNTFGQSSPTGLDGYGEYRRDYGTIPVTSVELEAYWIDFQRSGLGSKTLTVEDVFYLLSILPDVSKENVYFPAYWWRLSLTSSVVNNPLWPLLDAGYYSPYGPDGLPLSERERFANARDIFTNWLQVFSTRNAFVAYHDPFSSVMIPSSGAYPTQYWYIPGITEEFDDSELIAYTFRQQEALSFSCFRVTSDRIEYFEAGKEPVVMLEVGDPALTVIP